MQGQPELSLIVAHDRRRAIGIDGRMPWHLPEDLKRFKRLTLGHPLLMGRRTFDSIGRALPGRRNLVLSRQAGLTRPGAEVVASLDQALQAVGSGPLWVIGGGEIYALCLPWATRLEITEVDVELEHADAWFPEFDRQMFVEIASESHVADAKHAFGYVFRCFLRVPGYEGTRARRSRGTGYGARGTGHGAWESRFGARLQIPA